MVMPPCGTFNYVATVPQLREDSSLPWAVRLAQPVKRLGHKLADSRLVGYAPHLQITDAGPPDSSYLKHSVVRSRLTLTASTQQDATVSSISFHIDRDLVAQLQPGDDLHMARTCCGGLGLSILRQGELVAAVGAVMAVNLGNGFEAFAPHNLIAKVSHKSSAGCPVEFVHKQQRRILFSGICQLGGYVVLLRHGFLKGMPGTDESAAICRAKNQIPMYANASAQLLEDSAPEIVKWPGE